MKTLIVVLLLLGASAFATNYTVKSGGGGNYTTIAACMTQMSSNGTGVSDTCTVFSGSYAEHPTVPAGSAGNYKIVTVNGSDVVTVQGFTVSSHTKLIGNCPALQGSETTAACGFFLTNPSSPTTACVSGGSSNTDIIVTGNNMYACGTVTFGHSGIESGIIFTGNTITYPDCTSGSPNTGPSVEWITNSSLFDSNDLSHDSDGIHNAGSNNIFRNNSHHDALATECGSNSGNCHIDMIETEPSQASNNLLYENNRNWNVVSAAGSHTFLVQADVCSGHCSYLIGRFNQVAHVDVGLENDNLWQYVKWYNNTLVDMAASNLTSGIVDQFSRGSAHGSAFNNLYQQVTNSGTNLIASSGAGGTNDAFWTGGYNLAYCTSSPCTVPGNAYGSGTWAGVSTYIWNQNPLLNGYSSSLLGDLSLQSGSPARNAGHYLTTANGSGVSSTALILNDEAFFQAGSTVAGVQGDCIAITTISNHVCLTAVNNSTHTVTLASPLTWSNGDSVWIYSISDGTQVLTDTTAPDLGAFPYLHPAPAPASAMFAELK